MKDLARSDERFRVDGPEMLGLLPKLDRKVELTLEIFIHAGGTVGREHHHFSSPVGRQAVCCPLSGVRISAVGRVAVRGGGRGYSCNRSRAQAEKDRSIPAVAVTSLPTVVKPLLIRPLSLPEPYFWTPWRSAL